MVQLDYTPNTESAHGKRWLPDEPLIDWLRQGGGAQPDYSVRTGAIDADPQTRERTEAVLQNARRQREEQLDRKFKQILEFCVGQLVDMVVFPEASMPAALIPTLVHGFRSQLAVFVGVGTLRPVDVDTLREAGFAVADEDIGCNVAVYIDQDALVLVSKRDRARFETMQPGSGTARVTFRKGGRTRDVGLAICRDYINAPRTFDNEKPMPDVVLVSALTRPTADFLPSITRNFPVAFSNHALHGGSAVLTTELQGFFVDPKRCGTDPLPLGEAIVIVDHEGFANQPSKTIEPANRLVCRSAVVYDDPPHDDPAGSLSSLARQLRELTLDGLNRGTYFDLLSVAEDRLRSLRGEGVSILLGAAQELRRNAGTLVDKQDLALFTTHLVLTDVKSEAEMRYETLGRILTEWWRLLDPGLEVQEPADGISRHYEQARTLRRQILPQVRVRYRDSPITERRGDRPEKGGDLPPGQTDGFTTFYSARLGSYGTPSAVRSLQQQLGVLRTLSAASDDSARLIYQVSTALQTSGHLAPFFDVVGVTESTDPAVLDDLREGVGQQLATAFRSSWDLTGGPDTGMLNPKEVVELRLTTSAIPGIREDWGTLIDYLRTLSVPVTVQMTCRRCSEQDQVPVDPLPPAPVIVPAPGLTGFFFPFENDAAGFMERARHEESDGKANLSLLVHVGSPEPLPDSVLRAVGQWLFHTMAFEIVRGPDARHTLAAGTQPPAGRSLMPSEILRLFHPPYGPLEGRGLDQQRTRSIPLPASISATEGPHLGKARIQGTRQDLKVDVRMETEARLRHTYVIGQTGSGKTNLLKIMARQDIVKDRGVTVIDPHGDLVDYLVRHTQKRDDQVLLLDFGDPDYLPVLNPLDLDVDTPEDRNLAIENFIDLLTRQSHHTFYGPRFASLVRLVLASTTDPNFPIKPPSVLDVGMILRNTDRKGWLQHLLRDVDGINEQWKTFNKMDGSYQFAELLDWALSKFSEMEQDGTLRHVLAGGQSTVSISQFVRSGGVLLVKIPEWEMSRTAAALLGGFIEDQVRRAAYQRWRNSGSSAEPYFLYVDEFQNFSLGGFEQIVAEARKFGLGLVLAHQNLDQLEAFSAYTGASSHRLRNAVLGNVANRVVFGVSSRDAAELAKDMDVEADVLRNPGKHRATAQILFDLKQYPFTLELAKAESDPGLRDQYKALRERMIDRGYWRLRDELRESEAARDRQIKFEVKRWATQRSRVPRSRENPRETPTWRREGSTGTDHVQSWKQLLEQEADTATDGQAAVADPAPAEDQTEGSTAADDPTR